MADPDAEEMPACVFRSFLAQPDWPGWIHHDRLASALLPLNPLAPGRTVVVSTEHARGVQDASEEALAAVMLLVRRVSVALEVSFGAGGVNVLNASGPGSGQSVDHLHLHVVPRWTDDGLETWPAGSSAHVLDEGWIDVLRDRVAEPSGAEARG